MRRHYLRLVLPVFTLLAASLGIAGEIGFVEDFALGKDRSVALRQLIPGTEEYYYYHGLHYLNSEQFDKVEAQFAPWLERFGQTPRLTEIQTRLALLTYDRTPQKSLTYVRDHLGLRFDHERVIPGAIPQLPTALDPTAIARATLRANSFSHWTNLDNFEDSALDWLAAENLDWERRRNLLQRLTRPDLPNLARLVNEDLRAPRAAPFGSYPIHRQMTLAQLDELEKLQPALLNQVAFAHTWLIKLRPTDDEDWRHDPRLMRSYFDRLLEFVRRLNATHNALKAHVLFHRLLFDRTQGNYDRALFIEYLQLPRQQPYMAKVMLESDAGRRNLADLNADFRPVTLCAPVQYDEPLVRSYLLHFLTQADSPRDFEPYINDIYLRHAFAEAKIVAGLGEPEQWASQLPPEIFKALKERVDIDFAFTNKTNFAADEPVRLDLYLKNVPTLVVKVFEINAGNYYREHKQEVNTDINLDGLIANTEQTRTSTEPPLRRMPQRFEFPQLSKPGVYVVDFLGAGKSSRALIRKGRLYPLVTTGTAGLTVTIVDDANKPATDATLWLGGQEYAAGEGGTIVVPFSTSPGRRPIVLTRAEFACLDYLDHPAESYSLAAGIHVDREQLLSRRVANLIVRPGLFLNGHLVSTQLLEEVKLRITSTDHDGISSTSEIPNFKLFEDRESTFEFRTPPRLASLTVTLFARVKNLSQGQPIELSAGQSFALNGIDKTAKIEDTHLAKLGPDYVIEVLGRTGERKPNRPVRLALKHRDFKQPVPMSLKSDARGRIMLGPLVDITNLTVIGPEETTHNWWLPTDRAIYSHLAHAKAGEPLTLPWVGGLQPTHDEVALFEMRGEMIRTDLFDALAVKDGRLELRNLAAGDYDLWLKKQGERIRIRVVDGPAVAGYVLGRLRQMELPALKPVTIASIAPDTDALTIRLTDASKYARVHIFAARYRPAYSAFADIGSVRAGGLGGVYPAHAESVFLTGRNIGDELRYVLDRRLETKYPGNMLERPALLLNPWAIRSTETGEQSAAAGEAFAPAVPPAATAPAPGSPRPAEDMDRVQAGEFTSNLDFLADAAAVVVNLIPDKDGIVRMPLKDLGPHALIHVVAVDPLHTISRVVSLGEKPTQVVDLRLKTGLDPQRHFTQQKQVTLIPANEPFTLADALGGRFEAYDSLPQLYLLYTTLSKDPKLAEFRFILDWPKLKPEEKRARYSKYACHELNFFLSKRDPEFFRTVIKPYLANKKDKTFLDRWLLEENVSDYLDPWQFGRLNTVERVLLAQRIAGEAPKTARHLNDLIRLQPPKLDRFLTLFETAVTGNAMAAEDQVGLTKMQSDLQLRERLGVTLESGQLGDAPGRVPMGRPESGAIPAPSGGFGGGRAGGEKKSEGAGIDEFKLRRNGKADRDKEANKDALRALEDEKPNAYFAEERRKLANLRQLYRRVSPTQEWAENNYYHLPIQVQIADLIPVGPFWLDYVKHAGPGPFLSKNVADASRNFTEIMFALSVLDLPFDAGKAVVKFDGPKMTYTPAGPAIAFHEEVRPAGGPAAVAHVLVSQNFYRHGDRFRDEEGEKTDKFVTGEFVTQTVYGSQIVVTNPTSSKQKLSVLVQTPVGSVPLANAQFTKSVLMDLEPYHTQTLDILFYFPMPGRFAQFPVHVAKNEALLASASPMMFDVVDKPSKLDTSSWEYVSQNGTPEEVVSYLSRENIAALDLEKIAFRMRDKAFFEKALPLLRERHVYHPTLWSYAIYYNVPAAIREFLEHSDQLATMCGGPIDCALVTFDPVARHTYEHLEYKPLVNARAHALGFRRQIVNERFLQHYHELLALLAHRKQLTDADLLAVTYYLLLQDRIGEALDSFGRVNPERVPSRLQYDYCAAYLAMFGPSPQSARQLAGKYADYPVDRWRNAFTEIVHQLDEADGKGPQIADADDRGQKQGQLAATEPAFELALDNKTMQLTWQNLTAVRVNYYLMDVEVLFSRNPFVQTFGGQFATIRPNETAEIKLPAGQNKLAVPLPETLAKRNVLVEVTAGGKTRSMPYYANAMDVRLTENYGQLRATDSDGKPLPKVYVKVYARTADGHVKFHKDGYTDLRGRFDYASVSTPEPQPIGRFAILALSEERGALIREAAPPQQ
jgi:hypothetical protein